MMLFLSILNKVSKSVFKQSNSAVRDLKVVKERWYSSKGIFNIFFVDFVFYQLRLIGVKQLSHRKLQLLKKLQATLRFDRIWFTKGEIFPSCFNFDRNRSASKKKMCSKNVSFLALSKNVSPVINDNKHEPSSEVVTTTHKV